MKFIIFFLFSCFLSLGVCAGSQQYLTKDQIILTNSGMFLLVDDMACPAYSVAYAGEGMYSVEYYGQCGRCGWAVDKNGKCTNQNCNQSGPRDRD